MYTFIRDGKLGGIPATIWIRNASLIRELVRKFAIKPATDGPQAPHLAALSAAVGERLEVASVIKRPPIPGGMRVPHLHLDGEVYLLNDKQWKEFTGKMIKDLQSRLSRVSAVSFEQAVDLSETIETLA